MTLTPDEIRIADNYNREYPGLSRDQAVTKAKQVLADIAARGKEVPPAFVSKPVNHHLPSPKTAAPATISTSRITCSRCSNSATATTPKSA